MRVLYFAAIILLTLSLNVVAQDTNAVQKVCEAIGAKLASVKTKECLSFNFSDTTYRSIDQHAIILKEFPPLGEKKSQAKILLIGGTHGDELTSISVVFKWLKILKKHHSGLFHWHITPLMNPDGLLKKKHSRTNANGVDLNRNFPPALHEMTPNQYWVKKAYKSKRRFPGKSPLSEPESQWLFDEIESFKPDVIVALHAPYKLVDYDAPNRKNAPKKIGRLYKNLMGTYPGSLGNYAGIQKGIPVITIELPHAGIMPTKQQIDRYWTDLVKWLINNTK